MYLYRKQKNSGEKFKRGVTEKIELIFIDYGMILTTVLQSKRVSIGKLATYVYTFSGLVETTARGIHR